MAPWSRTATQVLGIAALMVITTMATDDCQYLQCVSTGGNGPTLCDLSFPDDHDDYHIVSVSVEVDFSGDGESCIQDESWDYNDTDIWVSHGCSADFLICYASATDACPEPSDIDHGSYTKTGLHIGATVTYSCNQDYGFSHDAGGSTRMCETGGWSGTDPECEDAALLYNGCSIHSKECDDNADCLEGDTAEKWRCECLYGLQGDGLNGEGHSGCGNPTCRRQEDCHDLATCTERNVCECEPGYSGNGQKNCENIDECLDTNDCHRNADCYDDEPGYSCACKTGYRGDGYMCTHSCNIHSDCNLPGHEKCGGGECMCTNGYTDNDAGYCVDIKECVDPDRCDENADCHEEDGGFKCTCKNGFAGDGFHCKELPLHCHQIKMDNHDARSKMYDIDVDGTGLLSSIQVYCEMRDDLGITVIRPVQKRSVKFYIRKDTFNYTYQNSVSTEHIKALAAASGYCYQDMSYKCKGGAVLLDNDHWLDGNGNIQRNWGGGAEGECACGKLGFCSSVSAFCNCDGSLDTRYDNGRIVDKARLPITQVHSVTLTGRAYVVIGEVNCAAKPFDIPRSCHEAKFEEPYIRTDGTQLVDVDGPDGPLEPTLVYCDMTSYTHVGITVVPRTERTATEVTSTDENKVTYVVNDDAVNTLVDISEYCIQEAGYECRKSRLMANGHLHGYFSDTRGNTKYYWPGGMGEHYNCGCGITDSCESEHVYCNCDIFDNQTRQDIGVVTDRNDLPIGAVTFTDIGGADQYGKYYVGPLRCAGKEFGIPPTCQGYANEGRDVSYTYQIDPDGPFDSTSGEGSIPPFPVHCQFSQDPPLVSTIINNWRIEHVSSSEYRYVYYRVTEEQVSALTERAISCTQTVTIKCQHQPLFVYGEPTTTWESPDGTMRSYYAGDGSEDVCTCGLMDSCIGGGACNCDMDDGESRSDDGMLVKKEDLPIWKLHFTSSTPQIEVGALVCQDLFPTCAAMAYFNKRRRLDSEPPLEDGLYTISPDGPLGAGPFVVKCDGSVTHIVVLTEPTTDVESDPDDPTTACFNFTYKDPNGNDISPEKVVALIKKSKYCAQKLSKICLNAPLTNHTYYETCDGVRQTGWAGGHGEEQCGCGVVGDCKGGPEDKCNCDAESGDKEEDGGWIVDSDRVGVCKACVTLDPASGTNGEPNIRTARIEVSDLYCSVSGIAGSGSSSCQAERNSGNTNSGPINIDPDGSGPAPSATYQCILKIDPPFGYLEVKPKQPEFPIPPTGTRIDIYYYMYELVYLRKVIEESTHCEQEIWLDCVDSSFTFTSDVGMYSYSGDLLTYWAGNTEETTVGCAGGTCNCNLPGARMDGGLITDLNVLPIAAIQLGAAPGSRRLRVGPVICYSLPRDCHEIKRKNLRFNLLSDNTYVIAPGGGVAYFPVKCDFTTDRSMGITVVRALFSGPKLIKNMELPGQHEETIHYKDASHDQIHALAHISGFCQQAITYMCLYSPLINGGSYYSGYGGEPSTSFGDYDGVGCACKRTHTCPDNSSCRCDEQNGLATQDYGFILSRPVLPITQVNFGSQTHARSVAMFDITSVRCGPWIFDLPASCQDAYERGYYKSGEIVISPDDVDPFWVYCDMDSGKGITIVGNNKETKTAVEYGETIDVDYHDATHEQLAALTKVSEFCYQPFKYDCFRTRFLFNDHFYWHGSSKFGRQLYVADGRTYGRECNCGRQGLCGGSEDRTTLFQLDRSCNCNSADDKWRRDGGIFNSSALPVTSLDFLPTGIPGSEGFVTLGKLYCADKPFYLNPCEMDFHDCHKHAKCSFVNGISYECRCRHGWNGHGVANVWANGRNCYDDDECALHRCPWSSTCDNTPGSFNCTCLHGFRKTGPTKCEDIDECKNDPCHSNATCHNYPGKYFCKCKRGYKGDGSFCEPVAECTCFGDPHCIGFDSSILHYQGQCQYTMTRDMCDDLSQQPTFEVIPTFYRGTVRTTGHVTWVKEVKFKYASYTVVLMQKNEVRVNNRKTNLPFHRGDLKITKFGKFVEIDTIIDVTVRWDGKQEVKVEVPGSWQNLTCGLCGNYNGVDTDDFVIGPACPDDFGTITDNPVIYGDSWVTDAAVADDPDTCSANCSALAVEPECVAMSDEMAQSYCEMIWSIHGMFQATLDMMDETVAELYLESCIYDMCHLDGDISIVLCESVEAIIGECEAHSRAAIQEFMDEAQCDQECGENMEYVLCTSQTDTSCSDVILLTQQPVTSTTRANGCYCREGYYLDVDNCVPYKDCGCVFNNNYYFVGDEVVMDGCNMMGICAENNNMDITDITCHVDATCSIQDGVQGCHCVEGMYGDGVNHCYPDPCMELVCGINETCIRSPDTEPDYKCQCSMGYMGDCGNCQEIDECATGSNDCPLFAECKNTPGSYYCRCLTGYTMSAYKCIDVDECELDALKSEDEPSICPENSRCSNKIGGYKCVCCQGFEMNDDRTECISTSSEPAVEQPKCCICDYELCNRTGKVCGEDGKTYKNVRDMIIKRCEAGLHPGHFVAIDYFGKCQSSCSKVECANEYLKCSKRNGKPTCDCEICTEEESQSGEICDTKLDRYPDMCIFKQAMCRLNSDAKPTNMEACDKKFHISPVGTWTNFGPCSVTCGKGSKARTRQAFGSLSPELAAEFKLEDTEACYRPPCVDGPCYELVECENMAAECVVTDEEEWTCECPVCSDEVYEPVCGFVSMEIGDSKQAMWPSECSLQRYACLHGAEDYGSMYPGKCIDEPLNCTRALQWQEPIKSITYPNCHSHRRVNQYECAGGCGVIKSQCCEPTPDGHILVNVPMKCNDGRPDFLEQVSKIKKCECT